MTTFRTTRRVDFCDTDMAGIVHFANFFRYMETAEVAFLRERGLSVKGLWQGQEIGLPRVAARCDYLKPAVFEDVLDIDVTVARIGSKSVTYRFDFSRQGEPIARGQVTCVWCLVQPDGRLEAAAIPAEFRALLEQ
jgi:YbgC/YbaW family acyl-CoA thioester hydrolase